MRVILVAPAFRASARSDLWAQKIVEKPKRLCTSCHLCYSARDHRERLYLTCPNALQGSPPGTQEATLDPNLILNRVMRLARLDTTVFDEVRDDQRETLPAVIVAVIAAFLAGLGAFLWSQVVPDGNPEDAFVNQFILGSIFLAVMYGVAALVAYVVLAQMYKVQADLQAIIRTMGYAAIPLAASVLMLLPIVFPVFAIVPMAALFVMMIYALQSATGADSNQVVMSALIGFAVMVLVCGLIAVSTDFGKAPMGAGIFGILFDFN